MKFRLPRKLKKQMINIFGSNTGPDGKPVDMSKMKIIRYDKVGKSYFDRGAIVEPKKL